MHMVIRISIHFVNWLPLTSRLWTLNMDKASRGTLVWMEKETYYSTIEALVSLPFPTSMIYNLTLLWRL